MNTVQSQIEKAILWLAGLAVTDLPQGRKKLGNMDTGFCCLGFGCFLLGIPYDPKEGVSYDLPYFIGMKSNNPNIYSDQYGGEICIAELNDTEKLSFKEIREVIIDNLDDVFAPKVAAGLKDHYMKD